MDPEYTDEELDGDHGSPYADDDGEYADDDELLDDEAPMDEELEELLKPEPLSFPDAYAAAPARPVELQVPGHCDAFAALGKTEERRFPARQVSRSAAALAEALRRASRAAR